MMCAFFVDEVIHELKCVQPLMNNMAYGQYACVICVIEFVLKHRPGGGHPLEDRRSPHAPSGARLTPNDVHTLGETAVAPLWILPNGDNRHLN